jgi:hypothetical protein
VLRNTLSASAAVAFALAGASTLVVAQETTSSIRGVVSSDAGAPVAGATVTIVHVPSGTTNTSTTGTGGTFSASGLRPGGPYTVTISGAGNKPATLSDVYLSVGEPLSLPIALGDPGAMAEVVVSGKAATALSAGPTTTLDRINIEGVASVTRDIRDIARRDPFAAFNPSTRGVSIAGQNNRTNRFAVDGVRFSDNFGLNQGGLPTTRGPVPLDAVEQMSIKIAPFDITEGDFQGGSINVVLRSGSNKLTGSAFSTYTDDKLTGDKSRGTPIKLDFDSKNWGAFLSGPIIENKLFFALSYEDLDETNPASFGLTGAPTVVPNLTQADLDEVSAIAQSAYGYDTKGIRAVLPETDKKYTGKIDWNINESHRLSYTGIFQKSYLQSPVSGGVTPAVSPFLNYASYATNEPEEVNSSVLALNSSWTNTFSTEARVNYRDYSKVPSSLGQAGFAQFQVCLDDTNVGSIFQCSQNGTPRVFMGTEQFSQADIVKQKQYGAELVAHLNLGDHALKADLAYNQVEVTNLFVQSALGIYYFDSVQAFQNKQASQFSWQNSITGDLADVEASFDYGQYTAGVQDSWNITPTLNLTYGLRWDIYAMSDKPPENRFFVNRYGMSNTNTIDGNVVTQPRINLTWRALDRLTVRGGVGLFSGGAPDVFIGNSFSVAGVYGNTLSNVTRTATGCTLGTAATSPVLPAAVCAEALNNVDGLTKGPALTNFLQTNTAALTGAPVNAMSDTFHLPSTWKASITADYLADLGPLGDNWNFGADIYQGWVKYAAQYSDLRLTRVGSAPDGRPIYADTFTNGTNNDLFMSNTSRGRSSVLVARIDKTWDFGLGAGLSYAHSNIKSLSDLGTAITGGSTASGTYGAQPVVDPNFAEYGTSSYEIRHNWKLNLDYSKAFVSDFKTRFSLFGEYRSGTPYSLTMNSAGSRSIFGTTGTANRYLLYVPDVSSITADSKVAYANATVYQQFRDYVVGNDLRQGEIIEKNSMRSPNYMKVDLHIEQELPVPMWSGGRFRLFADVENLLNLIDDDYGAFRYYDPLSTVVNVSCPTAAAGSCPQYRYDSFTQPTLTNQGRLGLWSIRIGAKIEF